MKGTQISTVTTINISGTDLTVQELLDYLHDLPGDGKITMKVDHPDRPGEVGSTKIEVKH